MTDHSELLKGIRELARTIASGEYCRIYCVTDAAKLRTLADIVEARDKRDAVLEGRIERYLETKLLTFDELLAACRTCEEAIKNVLAYPEAPRDTLYWINLRAARHLAKRAVEEYDKTKGGASITMRSECPSQP